MLRNRPSAGIVGVMIAMPMLTPHTSPSAEHDAKLRAIAEARAISTHDGVIDHTDMVAWLDSWGTPNELPPPAATRPWK
jgi:hypothetical protein